MRTAIIQTDFDKKILDKIEYLVSKSRWEWVKKGVSDLPVERIQEIAAGVFLIPPSELLGKIDHKNQTFKIYKLAFYAGMYLFSNKDSSDCKDFTGTRCGCFYSSDSTLLRILKWDRKRGPVVYDFIKALWEACPNRIDKLTVVDYSMIDGVSNWPSVKLTPYQISKIPVKDKAWFNNNNTQMTILGFNLSKLHECKWINSKSVANDGLLCQMQNTGYRFCKYDEHYEFAKLNAICDRCVHKNICSDKAIGKFGGYWDSSKSNFECFEDIPTETLKVDLHLLYPLKSYQLQ